MPRTEGRADLGDGGRQLGGNAGMLRLFVAIAAIVVGCGFLPSSDPVALITAPNRECFAADVTGLLVVDPIDGTAIVGDGHRSMLALDDVPVTVAWPPGFTGRRSGAQVEVLDPHGQAVGITGRSYTFLGGFVRAGGSSGLVWPELTNDVLLSCGNLRPVP
jgi:hypothetical protein